MATSYLTMLEKTDNTTRLPASEFNEIKDALTDGTRGIITQCIKTKAASYIAAGVLNVGGTALLNSTAGAMAMTLADPGEAGIRMTLIMSADGGDVTVTAATAGAFDATNKILTFSAALNCIELVSISSTRWQIVVNSGVTLSAS